MKRLLCLTAAFTRILFSTNSRGSLFTPFIEADSLYSIIPALLVTDSRLITGIISNTNKGILIQNMNG
jgi:hypothetical protein